MRKNNLNTSNDFDYAIEVVGIEFGMNLTVEQYEKMVELAGRSDLDYAEIQELFESVM